MRCRACDVKLSNYECTLRSTATDEYLDMCEKCLGYIDADIRYYSTHDGDKVDNDQDG